MSEERFDHKHLEVPKHIHPEIPEHREKPEFHMWWVGDWRWPTLAAGFTVLWGLLIFWLVGERPTTWDYGVKPYVPAQSYLSSREAQPGKPPRQLPVPKTEEKTGAQ